MSLSVPATCLLCTSGNGDSASQGSLFWCLITPLVKKFFQISSPNLLRLTGLWFLVWRWEHLLPWFYHPRDSRAWRVCCSIWPIYICLYDIHPYKQTYLMWRVAMWERTLLQGLHLLLTGVQSMPCNFFFPLSCWIDG